MSWLLASPGHVHDIDSVWSVIACLTWGSWRTQPFALFQCVKESNDMKCKTFNSLWPNDTIWWHRSGSKLAQVMAGLLPYGTKPKPKPMLIYHQWCLMSFTWEQFHKKSSWIDPLGMVNITLFKLLHLTRVKQYDQHVSPCCLYFSWSSRCSWV